MEEPLNFANLSKSENITASEMEVVRMAYAALSHVPPGELSQNRASNKSFTGYCRLNHYNQQNAKCNGSHTNAA